MLVVTGRGSGQPLSAEGARRRGQSIAKVTVCVQVLYQESRVFNLCPRSHHQKLKFEYREV